MKREATHSDIRCPKAGEHKGEANVRLLVDQNGDHFCAVHGDFASAVVANPAPLHGASAGREAIVVREYHYNGEGWLDLIDTKDGTPFSTPSVFWTVAR